MHDGVFRRRGLNKSEKELVDRLEKPEIFNDDQVEQSLAQVVAEVCQLDPILLPENLPEDLWVREKLIEQARAKPLNQFSLEVFRRLECGGYWDAAHYPVTLREAIQAEQEQQLDKLCRLLEAKARPGCHPKALQAVKSRFERAARKIKVKDLPNSRPSDIAVRETRHCPKQLNLDAPIQGARRHVP